MFHLNTKSKFILGILLLQIATAIQVIAALNNHNLKLWLILGVFSLVHGGITALWFFAITKRARREAVADIKEEKEELAKTSKSTRSRRTNAESATGKDKDKNSTQAEPEIKVRTLAPIVGLVGLGAILLLSQLITIGLLAISATVGVVAGYFLGSVRRTTQELVQPSKPIVIQHDATYPALTHTPNQSNRRRGSGRTPRISSKRVD